MKILITGGHLSPALAFIEKFEKKYSKESIVFVGRKYINNFEQVLTLEYKEITSRKIKFIDLPAGRLTRLLNFRSILNLFYVPIGFFKAWQIITTEKPDLVLSFGGYIALPIALAAFLKKIPIYTHEQTINPGIANKIIGYFAKKVFISFPESKKFFKKEKILLTGNLIRDNIFKIIKKPFKIKKDRPVIYITGGSLGSHSINLHIKNILHLLLKKYIVIHQTGETKQYKDYEKLKKIKHRNYFVKKHFFHEEIGYIYHLADLIIARAGANTFFELLSLKKPAILIPLPWSANREQIYHAKLFVKLGLGEIFYQGRKDKELIDLIEKMFKNLRQYKLNFENLPNDYQNLLNKNASQYILQQIEKEIQ